MREEPAIQLATKVQGALNTLLQGTGKVEPDGPNRFYVTDHDGNIVLVTTQVIARRHTPARVVAINDDLR